MAVPIGDRVHQEAQADDDPPQSCETRDLDTFSRVVQDAIVQL
jgi:hypothetical protein